MVASSSGSESSLFSWVVYGLFDTSRIRAHRIRLLVVIAFIAVLTALLLPACASGTSVGSQHRVQEPPQADRAGVAQLRRRSQRHHAVSDW
jgi:hypothetical protein